MPLIKSAKKKLRQDKKRSTRNFSYEDAYKKELKKIKSGKSSEKSIQSFYSKIDKAAKKNIVHKNKANRLKSRISKLVKHA